jgi:hypothetical protein
VLVSRPYACIALAVLAAGCASPYGKIVPVGPDTYTMTSHGVQGRTTVGWSTAGEQKAQIYEGATAYCGKQGKAAELIAERQTDLGWGRQAGVEATFRCVFR